MAQVDIQLGYKDSAWFTTNATHILLAGQIVYLDQTGTYKIGDGITQLSALSFLGGSTQVNSDWNATSGVAQILNKPTIPAAQIQSDWNQTNNVALDYIKNKPTIGVGDITGLYVGLTGNQTVAGQKTFSDNLTYDNGTVNTKLLPVPTVPTYMGMFLNTATPNSTNATIYKDASGNTFVNGTSVYTASNAVNYTRTVSSLFQILTGINLQLVDGTASRVLYLDASKNVKTSTVTDTTLGYLDATSSIQTQLNGKLSTTITSVAKGDTVEYNGSAWVNVAIQYTVELIDALTIDIYAPYGMKINSVTNILNSPTTTILVGGSAYTLGNTITTGQKITVTVSVAAVVTLNINKV